MNTTPDDNILYEIGDDEPIIIDLSENVNFDEIFRDYPRLAHSIKECNRLLERRPTS